MRDANVERLWELLNQALGESEYIVGGRSKPPDITLISAVDFARAFAALKPDDKHLAVGAPGTHEQGNGTAFQAARQVVYSESIGL